MQYEREKYEQLILDSPLFSLDKETEYTAFKRESYRMVEYLYCYLLSINEAEYEQYGCEITEVSTRCISNFDYSKGVFLHYFNAAWKQAYSHIRGRKKQEEKLCGIRITEADRRLVRNYIRLSERMETNCDQKSLYIRLSEAMGISVSKISELAMIGSLNVCSDSIISTDGDELSIWDQIPDNTSMDQYIETAEGIEEILLKIEKVFNTLQARQKPIVSDLLSVRMCSFLSSQSERGFSFVSDSIVKGWAQNGTVPTQRDIAMKYGRDEASISRTLKDFLTRVKKENK